MIRNPVYSREMKISSRSIRPPLIIVLFNGILSMATLFNTHSAVVQVKSAAVIQYSSFMDMYEFVTTIEFILLMFIVSAVTAASTNGERERQTLGLMLTTQMTASQVAIGKLTNVLSTLPLLIVSSFPVVVMVLIYEGIIWQDILPLLLCYITAAFLVGSLGICFSTLFKRSTIPTVVTYGALIAMVAGTYSINKFSSPLFSMNISNSVAAYGFGENVVKPLSGNMIYPLLLNLMAIFYTVINGQMGGSTSTAKIAGYFGMQPTGFVMRNWTIISIMTQLVIAVLMIWAAIKVVGPVRRRCRQKKAAKKGD